MNTLLLQLKKRRLQLGFKQEDMLMRVGVSRQQYQRLESKGNPRLDTLQLIAKGLKSEIMLIPTEKRDAVIAVLENPSVKDATPDSQEKSKSESGIQKQLSEDPWKGLLGDGSDE